MRPLTAPPRPGAPPLAAPRRPQADAPRHDLRRDPAPTIWAYRMQRVMLTPYLRALLRVGLPSLAVLAAAAIYLSDEARRDGMARIFTDLREKFEQRPEFMVTLASVEGCSIELAEAVRDKLALRLPQSSFDLDLEAARLRIEGLDAVKSADLRVRSGGILEVIVTEREPVAIWRTDDGLTLVDDTGHRVASLLARSDRPDLPLIAGLGADAATPEALEVLAAAGPLIPRLRGLVRVGNRRWDLVLDRGQTILLPDVGPVRALERLIALDQAEDILNRDLLAVDLRVSQRPTLRLSADALTELRRAQGLPVLETNL